MFEESLSGSFGILRQEKSGGPEWVGDGVLEKRCCRDRDGVRRPLEVLEGVVRGFGYRGLPCPAVIGMSGLLEVRRLSSATLSIPLPSYAVQVV